MARTNEGGGLIDRSDWLLLLVAADAIGAKGPDSLDPVRVQKGMFLLSQSGPARNLYSFRPYNWGPFSPAIYADLDRLIATGLLKKVAVAGQSWAEYSTTAAGASQARALAAQLDPTDRSWLAQLRDFLTTRSFSRLLRDVYSAFPEYATNSLLR